jgi:hypothetical protein
MPVMSIVRSGGTLLVHGVIVRVAVLVAMIVLVSVIG